jgi:DNA-directed RNA polymerase subunit K/omega
MGLTGTDANPRLVAAPARRAADPAGDSEDVRDGAPGAASLVSAVDDRPFPPGSGDAGDRILGDRFYQIALIFQRARQLKNGAHPRVYSDGHKPTRLAQMEVMAGLISWEILPEPEHGLAKEPVAVGSKTVRP